MKYLILSCLLLISAVCFGQTTDSLAIRLENYKYPYPVQTLQTTVQGQQVEVAYIDVATAKPANKVVVLFHGKNFPAAYWKGTIRALNDAGYRVIAPDALGFGKSSKLQLQYSFSLLASLVKEILDTLNIDKVSVVGHSMGGMLAARFALTYPKMVSALVLEDALGLEDWRAEGVPYRKVDDWYADEKKATYESILQYHKTSYYPVWKEEYSKWVKVQYGVTLSKNFDQLARVNALTYDMIFTQPVVHEFKNIKAPTLVIVGSEDKTRLARNTPDSIMKKLGHYRELGKRTADAIPNAKLITYEGVGHVPHLEIPQQFHADLINFLKANAK
ncbi:MAG: alpha/beta hydrolase [Sphingobacteriales bacterium]|nr:MAG: alpha/beta hydrolase [Sphingobacteriales bacterium]